MASFNDSYCYIEDDEVCIKNLHISGYDKTTYDKSDPLRIRKLLLNKTEIKKIKKNLEQKGYTLVPIITYENTILIAMTIMITFWSCQKKEVNGNVHELKTMIEVIKTEKFIEILNT